MNAVILIIIKLKQQNCNKMELNIPVKTDCTKLKMVILSFSWIIHISATTLIQCIVAWCVRAT